MALLVPRRAPALAARILGRRSHLSTTSPSNPSSGSLGYLPDSASPFTNRLDFFSSVLPQGQQIPTYRVLDSVGNVLNDAELPEVYLHWKSTRDYIEHFT
jgi:2-oxoisovalerate dehydrogenase E1 component alpha subunit